MVFHNRHFNQVKFKIFEKQPLVFAVWCVYLLSKTFTKTKLYETHWKTNSGNGNHDDVCPSIKCSKR
jgi:hypothetical protein